MQKRPNPPCFFSFLALIILFSLIACAPNDPIRKAPDLPPPADLQSALKESYEVPRKAGFIRHPPVTPLGTIIGARSERDELAMNERIFISPASGTRFKAGQRCVVYRLYTIPQLKGQVAVRGSHHFIIAIVEVLRVSDRLAEVKIVRSFREINRGDKVMEETWLGPLQVKAKPGNPELCGGQVIINEEHKHEFTADHLLLLNKGVEDGLAVGDAYGVYEEKMMQGRTVSLYRGELLVVRAEPKTATAMVIDYEREFYPGIHFHSRNQPKGICQ